MAAWLRQVILIAFSRLHNFKKPVSQPQTSNTQSPAVLSDLPSENPARCEAPPFQKERTSLDTSLAEDALVLFIETLVRKDYSYKTIKVYASYFRAFLRGVKGKNLLLLSNEDIRAYLRKAASEKLWSPATQNQAVNAISFYFVHALGQDRSFRDLRLPRPLSSAEILSEEEVLQLLNAAPKLKYRAILTLIYVAGLRLGEAVNIRIDDLHWHEKRIFIKGGRARNDRFVTIPSQTWTLLHLYLRQDRPQHWLFEGPSLGPLSVRSIQQVMNQAVAISGVNPHATIQMLRHSLTSHLLIKGKGLRTISTALGNSVFPTSLAGLP